jgi:hypothetical protein
MQTSPYNLYIDFEVLNDLFKSSNNKEENLLKCGLTALELSIKLLHSFIKETSDSSNDKIDVLLKDIQSQLILLKTFVTPLEKQNPIQPYYSDAVAGLQELPATYIDQVATITQLYFDVAQKAQLSLGLEQQINRIRIHFGLSTLHLEFKHSLNYSKFISADVLQKLYTNHYYNSEDELFIAVHQVSECWFNVGLQELNLLIQLFQSSSSDLSTTVSIFKFLIKILLYSSDHILLLEQMVLANYHPLRVALRGASGGQSQQAHQLIYKATRAFSLFLARIQQEQLTLIKIIEAPTEYPLYLSIIKQFEKLERTLKNFFFQHYALSASIIGAQSFGSIGQEIVSLADRFVEPLFQELDQAKYELTLKTNFKYGETSGVIILAKENRTIPTPPSQQVLPPPAEQTVQHYFEAISELNASKWIGLFSKKGYIEDPVGSSPYLGSQELSVFFKGVQRTFAALNMTIKHKNIREESIEVAWQANALAFNGKKLVFEGKEVFRFDEQGKILSAQVHWNPSSVADQL